MLLLRPEFGSLASIAAKEASRYALCGILVEETGGRLEMTASNGKELVSIGYRGPAVSDFPEIEGFDASANGVNRAILPAEELERRLKAVPKRPTSPVLGHAALTLTQKDPESPPTATVAITDGNGSAVGSIRCLEGSFPDWRRVVPDDKPFHTVELDAGLLTALLKVAQAVMGKEVKLRMDLYGPAQPLKFSAEGNDRTFLGLLMPMGR